MVVVHKDDRRQLDGWLVLLDGPGYQGREARDRAVAEMRTAGADRLFPMLVPMLTDPDPEARCKACEAALWVDHRRAFPLVLPLLDDADERVRWFTCLRLHHFGDARVINALIRVLQSDSDAQVRGAAAYALGGIRSLAAIPTLLAAIESDHELDMHGHSPSSCAAGALDDILGTHETRIRLSEGLCKLPDRPPDLERLKRLARKTYEYWSKSQAQPDTAAEGERGPGS